MNWLQKGRAAWLTGLGQPHRVASTRELVAHQNYILVYEVAGDLVRVLRVLHAAMLGRPVADKWPIDDAGSRLGARACAAGCTGIRVQLGPELGARQRLYRKQCLTLKVMPGSW